MKLKRTVVVLFSVLLLSLCACRAAQVQESTPPVSAVPEQTPQPSANIADETEQQRLEAYQFALEKLSFEHIWADGTDSGFDASFGFIEDNQFALYDVDGDGTDELIVQFLTAPVAGQMEVIYGYTPEDGLKTELIAYPVLTYYANGMIKADWSHGSELAAEGYWPYSIYQYSAESGEYLEIAQVNMWSRERDEVDYKGDPYPTDIDVEGAGTVFIVERDGVTETISKSEYESWLESLDLSSVLDIPYQALTEQNIKALQAAAD